MPLGAYRLNSLAKAGAVAVTGRTAIGLTSNGNVQYDENVAPSNAFGQSIIRFDGSGDYIQGDNFAVPATGEFTLEYRYRSDTSSTTRTMFSQYYGGSANEFTIWQSGSDTINMYYQGAGGHILSSSAIADNTYHHIAITRNSSNRFDLWINGTSVDNHTTSGSLLEQNIMIGARLDGGGPGTTEYVDGAIDEIRVSTVCRYTSSFTPPTAPHINDEDTAFLCHGDGFDGQSDFYDDTGTGRAPNVPNVRFAGEYDTAQYKFGTSSWYQSSENDGFKIADESFADSLGTGDYTIECFVRKDTDVNQDQIIWHANNQMSLKYDDVNNTLEYCADNGETTRITGGALNNNTWYHVAVSRSSGTTKLFIDGTQSGSDYSDDRSFANNTEYLIAIGRNGDKGWRGHIDEMRFSSSARYTSNFTAPSAAFENDSDTVFLYHFEGADGTNTSVRDDNS